jgi:hypothetical protein
MKLETMEVITRFLARLTLVTWSFLGLTFLFWKIMDYPESVGYLFVVLYYFSYFVIAIFILFAILHDRKEEEEWLDQKFGYIVFSQEE